MLQIGITGGIGSGKSIVCKIFSAMGVPVYDADSRAKSLMTTDGILIEQIKKEFGVLSFHADGTLNRAHLAQAFKDAAQLNRLNQLVHPRVAIDYEQWRSKQKGDYLVKEAALLFETESYRLLDKIIVVQAPVELRVKRVMQRDPHRTKQQLEDIIARQMKEEEKLKRADFVVWNDESKLVIPQVLELHGVFIEMAKKKPETSN